MHASASVALLLCLVHSSAAFAPPVEGPGRGGVSARALPRLSQPCVPLRRVVPVPRLPRRPPARLPPRVPPETVGTAPRAGDGDAAGGARPEIAALKQRLVEAVRAFKAVQARDGAVSVDFGVGGGELDGDTRAPRNLASAGAFYAVSEELGRAADAVADLVSDLEAHNPTAEPTKYFNTPDGAQCPLHGPWQLFFTTAADASFSSNSTRGDARASNDVDGVAGRITNVITFANRSDGELPVVKELRVELAAEVASRSSITFRFKFVRVYLNSLFGLPIRRLFGRALPLVIPVPGPFLTRILYSVRRVFGQKGSEPPKPRFEVLFLDQELRIHRTGEGNIFVQGRPHWLESISS